ncbi:MAG: hypothetical protein WC444_00140 [Candidatus Paceibacterota bacterium]
MKKYLKFLEGKVNIWNLFIGLVIGFGLGVSALNALIPNANQMIEAYRLDKDARRQDRMMKQMQKADMISTTTVR